MADAEEGDGVEEAAAAAAAAAEEELRLAARPGIYRLARRIKRRDSTRYNALRSIAADAAFVAEVAALWPSLPLVANLRCGLWYTGAFDAACYFKSTDGHAGNWSFSLTRLNMHLALLAAARGGVVIVDATRKGKRFPDSFSKTVPMWACVLNRAVAEVQGAETSVGALPQQTAMEPSATEGPDCQQLSLASCGECTMHYGAKLPGNELDSGCCSCGAAPGNESDRLPQSSGSAAGSGTPTQPHHLHLPLWVSAVEQASIELRLADWVRQFRHSGADIVGLARRLRKPLRPLWVSQRTVVWTNKVPQPEEWPFTPLILVSASRYHPCLPLDVPSERDMHCNSYNCLLVCFSASLRRLVVNEEAEAAALAVPLPRHVMAATLACSHRSPILNLLLLVQSYCLPYKPLGVCMGPSANHEGRPEVAGQRMSDADLGWTYIPGAADDEESWAKGLTPELFWRHSSEIIAAGPADCDTVVARLVNTDRRKCTFSDKEQSNCLHWIGDSGMAISSSQEGTGGQLVGDHQVVLESYNLAKSSPAMDFGCCLCLLVQSPKHNHFSLQRQLPAAIAFSLHHLSLGCKLLITSPGGADASVCICLAILLALPGKAEEVTKVLVRRNLAYISSFCPDARPCRGNLRQVFNFFCSEFSID
eukprot:SM000074S21725  [mRNA]  locus=s74:614493:618139:- [translate_table: standard]